MRRSRASAVERSGLDRAAGRTVGASQQRRGDPIDHQTQKRDDGDDDQDDRTVALPLADLSALERRVCIAGGRVKSKALAVALAAGFITHLATDSAAAQGILEYARRHGLGRD